MSTGIVVAGNGGISTSTSPVVGVMGKKVAVIVGPIAGLTVAVPDDGWHSPVRQVSASSVPMASTPSVVIEKAYAIDVWMSYGGGYTDLPTGATWDEPIGHCGTPSAHTEYADISTACSSFRFLINCL